MATIGTIRYEDDAVVAAGAVRGWKIGFGYAGAKGTIVSVYRVGLPTATTEIAKLANGRVDTNAVTAYLTSFGITLTQALKNVIGA